MRPASPTLQTNLLLPDPMLNTGKVRMWLTIVTHLVVDFFSFVMVPLMSVIEGRVGMTQGQAALILGAGAISSGLIQPIIALISDKHDTRILGTLGFLVAVICVCSVGFVSSFQQLLLLQIIGAAGIGAFHPVAAAAVGQLSAQRRARGLALFHAAGMIGGVLGNVVTPHYFTLMGGKTDAVVGLKSLIWLCIPGLLCVIVLAWAIHGVAHRSHDAATKHAQLEPLQRKARWRVVWLLYAGNVLRFMGDMCLIQLVIRWTETKALLAANAPALTEALRAEASQLNGPLQAAKQVGMGLGGLVIGFLIARRHEKALLLWVPMFGAVALAAMPHTGYWVHLSDISGLMAMLLCLIAGIGYAGVVPTTIAIAQRMLPHRTSLASGLMMGGAWSIAALGPTLVQFLLSRFGLNTAFAIVGAMLAISGLLALLLPNKLLAETR